jgi:hypothetical protein
MTTRGARAKDFEVMTAITQMWKDAGIEESELEVITIPQRFALRSGRGEGGKNIAPLSLYFWSNASGDPINGADLRALPDGAAGDVLGVGSEGVSEDPFRDLSRGRWDSHGV